MSVEEEHRGVMAATRVGISKVWGLRICRIIFELGPGVQGAPGWGHFGFQSLVGPQWEHRKCQSVELAALKAVVPQQWLPRKC